MTRRLLGYGIVGLLLISISALAQSAGFVNGVVTRVIDGDTVVVNGVGTVRLIGIDTPEMTDTRPPVQAFARQASDALSGMVLQKLVRLEFDEPRKDRFDRTLAYMFLGDTLVNSEMVRNGFAHAYVAYPFERMEQFTALEAIARSARRGLWADRVGEPIERALQQTVQPPATDVTEPEQVVIDFGPRATGFYHRADCPWMRGLTTTRTFTIAEAKKRYFQPHCQCVHGEDRQPPCPHVPRSSLTAPAAQTLASPAPTSATPARAVPDSRQAAPAAQKPGQQIVTRCQAITKKGTQCLRNAQPGRSYCWQHGGE